MRPQRGLLRIAAEDGKAVPGRANPGRGCYICRDPRCAQAAAKSGAIARALKGKAGNPPLEALLGWIQDRGLPLA